MKKLLIAGVALLSVGLVGCVEAADDIPNNFEMVGFKDDTYYDAIELRHKQTGCRYLLTDEGAVALTNPDGSPYCPPKQEGEELTEDELDGTSDDEGELDD